MEVDRKDEDAKRQHPETDNRQESHRATQNQQDADNDPQDRGPGDPHPLVAESHRRHEKPFSEKKPRRDAPNRFGR
jgi:hypothetical protein|tara:strand:+ start:281 stop:508 length:228 start_codon:yes stop_codon:yes gene_type:complete